MMAVLADGRKGRHGNRRSDKGDDGQAERRFHFRDFLMTAGADFTRSRASAI
jgi:hypothetical protein